MRCALKGPVVRFCVLLALALPCVKQAHAEEPATPDAESSEERPVGVLVEAPRVANEQPALTFSAPVTALRFEPLVDLQERNSGEAQGDLVIRGGTFETAGVRIGAGTILDPQTGHYLTEIPLDPAMLTAPRRIVGLENALLGFNHGSGSVLWDFSRIDERKANLTVGFGDFRTNVQSLYVAGPLVETDSEGGISCDVGASRSESNGTRINGDSEFSRVAGRCQIQGDGSQTDVVVGYQEKSFSWPYLYALRELHELVGSSGIEYESLHTTLAMINHRVDYAANSFFEIAPVYRRNRDNYEFDKFQPGLFNPFEHTTQTAGVNAHGDHRWSEFGLRYAAQTLYEDVESTALVFGDYLSRNRLRFSLVPTYEILLDGLDADDSSSPKTTLTFAGGAAFEDSNRSDDHLSPLAEIELERVHAPRHSEALTLGVTQVMQLPGFTAIGSNPSGGLFRGNQNLEETISTTYELAAKAMRGRWSGEIGVFYREDDDLVDWTYSEGVVPFASRTANNVDVQVTGTELSGRYEGEFFALHAGYFYLTKDSTYDVDVDASFYALNFPRHRVTGALLVRPVESIDVRFDVEFRDQEPNSLRESTDTTYSLGALSATFYVPGYEQYEISVVVDNLWNENFEEVPGVPGLRRSAGVFFTARL